MTQTARKTGRPAKPWSYSTGERGINRVRVYDRGARGLFLEFRESTDGTTKKVRLALGTTDREAAKAKADALALTFRAQARAKPRELTLATLFEKYEREVTHGKSASKQAHDTRAAEMFMRFFGPDRVVKTLCVSDWMRFIAERRRGAIAPAKVKTARTVRDRVIEYDLRFLLAVLNFGTMAGDGRGNPLLERNPLKGLPIPKEESPQRPTLSAAEYQAMLTAAASIDPLFELVVIVAHETGHRANSIRHLRWSDIDLGGKLVRWRGENDKIGFEHTTPLTDAACAALKARRTADRTIGDTWVLPAPSDASKPISRQTLLGWWKRGATAAKLAPAQRRGFHSLRRNFASEMKHTPLRDLAHLGGWKSTQTVVQVYQQPDEETQRDALAARKPIKTAAQG